MIGSKRIIIVSNRLPVNIQSINGKFELTYSIGGLATALSSVHEDCNSIWVGWSGDETISKNLDARLLSEFGCKSVLLSKNDIEKFYQGFCNKTVWPLFHSFSKMPEYSEAEWDSYISVNRKFCDEILSVSQPGDTIWIHDYHLMLLPAMLREKIPDAKIGFFLHIPFPHIDIFKLLPWRTEILNGILGSDLIGFHTHDYTNNFLNSVLSLKGINYESGRLNLGDRTIIADTFPLGIDFEKYFQAAEDPKIQEDIKKLRKTVGNHKIIFSIDRLDYTKGIPERLDAFDLFIKENPEWIEKVTFVLAVAPSRVELPLYLQLKKKVDELVGRINGKYSRIGWSPVVYIHSSMDFNRLVSLYVISDVGLITPLRDGMNLVAKEYVAANSDGVGVLILSEMTGAAKELGEAIIVNPNNAREISNAIKTALMMPIDEQMARNKSMQDRLKKYDLKWWTTSFLKKLDEVKSLQERLRSKTLTQSVQNRLKEEYEKSKKRIIFLDYDGTLVPFANNSADAAPDTEIISLLSDLASDIRNEVVIISGRDRTTLEKWFGNRNLSLVAEHGAWICRKSRWELIEPLSSPWKKTLKPFLQMFVDRVPNSYIEEKKYSLAWHYRNVKSSAMHVSELLQNLVSMTLNMPINILNSNKVIELTNSGISKGRAARLFLSDKKGAFILGIGDDTTDETMFKELPNEAYSIRVGMVSSNSRFNVNSYTEVRKILRNLIGLSKK